MNKFTGVGTLPRNAVVHGSDRKVLRFTLATVVGHNRKTDKDMLSYVPCVVFRPSEAIISLLAEDAQGLMIGVEGRVNTSRYESNGQTKYSTEVVVNEHGIQLLEARIGSESDIEKVA